MADGYHIDLIRHLPTAGNKGRKYIGWMDEPILKPVGLCLDLPKTKVVYGSDLLRARQTAELFYPHAHYQTDWRWRECHFGDFEGKTYEELEKNKVYRKWIDEPYLNAPTGGESLQEVETRVLEAVAVLPNNAVVVTHGGPIRVILSRFSSEDKSFWAWEVKHGEGYRLEWEDETAFKEGKRCTSISAVPIMVNGHL